MHACRSTVIAVDMIYCIRLIFGGSLVWWLLGQVHLVVIYIGVTSFLLLRTCSLLLADTIIGSCKATPPNRQIKVTAKFKSYTVFAKHTKLVDSAGACSWVLNRL